MTNEEAATEVAPAPEEEKVEYPSEAQRVAAQLVEAVKTIASLTATENAPAVRAAVEELRGIASTVESIELTPWIGAWWNQAADLIVAGLRADEGSEDDTADIDPDEHHDPQEESEWESDFADPPPSASTPEQQALP